jgi:flagellar biosynthetic protein FlhB
MSEFSEDQVHAATPARREQARRDGDIPKSFELAAALQMIGALAAAYLLMGQIGHWLKGWTTKTWSEAGSNLSVTPGEVTHQLQSTMNGVLGVLLPMMALLMLIGIASHWLQTGPLFLSSRLSPQASRLGPENWKRQVFSISSLAFLFVGIPKIVIAVIVLGTSAWYQRSDLFLLASYPTDAMVAKMFALILTITFHVALALLITSAADYGLKFAGHQRRIKLTDQQLRDELRMQNGDPQTRSRQRQLRQVSS